MRDRPHHNHRLEWPGGIVPEWARPQQDPSKRRRGKGGAQVAGKRERLQKVMAQSGHGSRRNIEILIAQGHITINGQVAKLGDSVGPGDKVKLDGELIRLRFGEAMPRVLMYHKPEGEIVTRDDPEGRATVFEKLPKVNGGRWVSVGRLDLNTGGLLLFTTNGELANRMMHPRFEVEREYAVRLLGELTEEQKRLLLAGVDIEGESCKFDSIEDRGGEGANHWYHVVLREGKNREVRRMCEAVGLVVSRLMRVRFGPVELPSFIKRGQMKEMDETQVQELMNFAGMNEPIEGPKAESEDEEDEHDNIGNRFDYHGNRETRTPREVDGNRDNVGNRMDAQPREVDGNRGNYLADAQAPRGPKPGARRGPKPFGMKKRGGGQGEGGQQHRKHGQGKGHAHPAAGPAGEGHTPRGPQPANGGNADGGPPNAGKPGRNRRNRNRHRNRNAGNAHGEAQPVSNGDRDPFAG
ncbi:MAG TPA: pseudouridine synthase [Usitatibacter sp.]|nr:pseudouridine synthase [Usitatibacter sp.]